ncbi:MAG: PEP-CTERM sorting domain-containing protein [Pirellulales bacterium]|nr:PEP-CTERM sorting domain-containing protein [Pirellulales bacterium]
MKRKKGTFPRAVRRYGLLLGGLVALSLAHVAQAGLVQYWTFDEGTGGVAGNSVVSGNEGTLMAGQSTAAVPNPAPNWSIEAPAVLSHSLGSLDFESSAREWVDAGVIGVYSDAVAGHNHGATLSVWIKPDNTLHDTTLWNWIGGGDPSIVGHNGGGPRIVIPTEPPPANILQILHNIGENSFEWKTIPTASELASGQWHHVAVTYVADKMLCYIDGQAPPSALSDVPFTFDNPPFGIGAKRRVLDSPQNSCFDGLMDDFAVWDVALTPEAIGQLVAGANPLDIVPRSTAPYYSQIVNIDFQTTNPLPAYTGRGALAQAGTVWNEPVIDGPENGKKGCALVDAVDSYGAPTTIDLTCTDFDLVFQAGTDPHPFTDDRLIGRYYSSNIWEISGLEVGATYDIYFYGFNEMDVNLSWGADADTVSFEVDGNTHFKAMDDLPVDWVEGINYVRMTVTPWLDTISGDMRPDSDGAIGMGFYGLQIARHSDQTRMPGDTDNSGTVDALDARALAEHWLQSGELIGWEQGDFNGDHVVDDRDASILAANWTGTSESNAVPEPSTLVGLLSLAGTALVLRRRRR